MDPLIVLYMDGYVRIGENNKKSFATQDEEASFERLTEKLVQEHKSNLLQQHDPVAHVKSQFKEAIGQVVNSLKDKTFKIGKPLTAEDSFQLYAADFVIDNNYDAWLVELHDEVKMRGEYVGIVVQYTANWMLISKSLVCK